ncbi:hypothetical protein OUZ56_033415 [Daphnia magna]|uniref:Uncharacterized protein n=1 Tax=Daphnia magna TaxID=35525 RepID=A0ABQ9ZYQ1_9CRUS|nr:hypothetical protein OUZ56_026332 [Daphnia magna]KAK4017709.1 hypothetical protein OUZ56_033415 [Daphnia magna]
MEETHELPSIIANSKIQTPEAIIEQPFTRMTAPTPLTRIVAVGHRRFGLDPFEHLHLTQGRYADGVIK